MLQNVGSVALAGRSLLPREPSYCIALASKLCVWLIRFAFCVLRFAFCVLRFAF